MPGLRYRLVGRRADQHHLSPGAITAEYERVAVDDGRGGVLAPTGSLADAAAVYFGDLITQAAGHPRCGNSVADVIRPN